MITDNLSSSVLAGSPAADSRHEIGMPAEGEARASFLQWPRAAWLYAILLALLYAPIVWETSRLWFTNDAYSHGVLILPLSAALIWLRRKEIATASPKPLAWGIVLLAGGLAMAAACYLLRVGYWAIWTLVPTLAGAVLMLHGKELWKIVGFAICFLIFAGPMPDFITHRPQLWTQAASTSGASAVMSTFGYALVQHGNVINLPQGTLDVAEVCSGFRKLTAFTAFGLIYGYLYAIPWWKRAVLALCAAPIAAVANIVRICGLIAATAAGGPAMLHKLHMPAEIFVLALSFGLFVLIGKRLGCLEPRFSI